MQPEGAVQGCPGVDRSERRRGGAWVSHYCNAGRLRCGLKLELELENGNNSTQGLVSIRKPHKIGNQVGAVGHLSSMALLSCGVSCDG
jgi:hypothetical protein